MSGIQNYFNLKNKILSLSPEIDFNETALEVFYYQYNFNSLYKDFCDFLHKSPTNISSIEQIPFLPISFFKSQKILSSIIKPSHIFKSSGTTSAIRSSHYITDIELYKASFLKGFQKFYHAPSDYIIFALLPSYIHQGESSLVFMVDDLIKKSNNDLGGFYLKDYAQLIINLKQASSQGKNILLLGVTYALLDLAELMDKDKIQNLIVMETGGMKGRRKEILREQLHKMLTSAFGVQKIHSEYGMTELLSQAYSKGDGIFYSSDTMQLLIRDTNDPFSINPVGKSGGINIIDLSNLNSCSFIATQDLGKTRADGGFEILGRFDNSDIRGCNLLVQ